jgi:hypothetical protein
MAIRVDGQGYLIDAAGHRLKENNSDAEAQARWAQIVADWKKTHKADGVKEPPPGTTIMQVEKGDCQWTIAEGAGADPIKTYQQLNEQFDDPDLIDVGDFVFVDKTTRIAVDRHGNNNVDLFRDQTAGRYRQAGSSTAEQQAIQKDVDAFLSTVDYDPTVVGYVVAPGDDKAWDGGNSAGRQQVLTTFFAHQKDNPARQTAATYIAGASDADPLLYNDVKLALASSGNLTFPGTTETNVGPGVTKYVASGDMDNTGVFNLEFKRHAGALTSGQIYDMNGNPIAAPAPINYSSYSYGVPNSFYFNYSENDWGNLEYHASNYMKSAPLEARQTLIRTMLADPEIKGRTREVAIAAYLRSFENAGDRDKAKTALLQGADAQTVKDINAGAKWAERRIA